MQWLNEHSGLLVLIGIIVTVLLLGIAIWLIYDVRKKIAAQKIHFLGMYCVDPDSRVAYAKLALGNKTLNNFHILELGVKNGKVNLPFTAQFRGQHGLSETSRIVIEQRQSVDFTLSLDELRKTVVYKNGKKQLKTLRLYAVDVSGTLYEGRVSAVRKLVKEILAADEKGMPHTPSVALPQEEAPRSAQANPEALREETPAAALQEDAASGEEKKDGAEE